MRKEAFRVGDYVHVYNRGNRKQVIVSDEIDRWRFLTGLRFYNDTHPAEFLMRSIFGEKCRNREHNLLNGAWRLNLHEFMWPKDVPAQEPIVKVISCCLMPNHYHLLLQEITEGGIAAYAQKIGTGFTCFTNIKYGLSGRLFEGSYKARVIDDINYLQYVDIYIQALNPFELLPGQQPLNDFDAAFDAALNNPFSSLGESLGTRNFFITDRSEINRQKIFPQDKESYRKLTKAALNDKGLHKFLGKLAFEE